jgi:hypothetical protein
MTQPSTLRPVALACFAVLALGAVSCGRSSSPVSPDAVASNETASLAPTAVMAAKPKPSTGDTFPLSSGLFTISNRKGSQITGSYSGESVDSNGTLITTLRLVVANGTGVYAGAIGELEGHGTGAFIGEGKFSLDVTGSLVTSSKKNAVFSGSLRGFANVGCSNGQILVSLHADGSKYGADLQHIVDSGACF